MLILSRSRCFTGEVIMALVRFGDGREVRGSIGGVVFSRNRYGGYMRNRIKPVNPQTVLQNQVRAAFDNAVQMWTDPASTFDRDGWKAYAQNVTKPNKLGEDVQMTPQNWFIGAAVLSAQAGRAYDGEPPTLFNTGMAPIIGDPALTTGGDVSFTLPAGQEFADQTGSRLMVWASRPQNGSRTNFSVPYKYVGALAGNAVPPTAFTGDNPWGTIPAGQVQRFKTRILYADNRVSIPVYFDVLFA